MILINLLPPELRKKRGNVNPIVYAVAAAYLLALLPAASWCYLKFDRLPKSQDALVAANDHLATATQAAADVEAMNAKIDEAQKQFDTVEALVGQKMYWAPVIDDFANHLTTQQWPGFEVCCTDFSIQNQTPVGGAAKGSSPTALLKGRYKLLGNQQSKAGDYINAFFSMTQTSPFWVNNGFVGRSSASYRGDTPVWRNDIERILIEFSLDWTRTKVAAVKDKKAGKEAK